MGQFWIGFSNFATSTANKTVVRLDVPSHRAEVDEIAGYGSGQAAPADIQHQFNVGFLDGTTAGTSTAVTPEKIDQASSVSNVTGAIAFTVEPGTYNANVFPLAAFNQRGGFRWAVPYGFGFKFASIPTITRFGVRVISNAVGAVDGEIFWVEP